MEHVLLNISFHTPFHICGIFQVEHSLFLKYVESSPTPQDHQDPSSEIAGAGWTDDRIWINDQQYPKQNPLKEHPKHRAPSVSEP